MSDYKYLTREQYLAAERVAEARSEYVAGEMVAMAGATRKHSLISGNIFFALALQLKGKPCETHMADMRVRVDADGTYTYPDISVTCGEARFEDDHVDTLMNPTVLIEVLSKSTENWDRGGKFEHYRRIESLSDYVLVSQEMPLVEHRRRQSDTVWLMEVIEGIDGLLRIESIGVTILLADIYQRISLATKTSDK